MRFRVQGLGLRVNRVVPLKEGAVEEVASVLGHVVAPGVRALLPAVQR